MENEFMKITAKNQFKALGTSFFYFSSFFLILIVIDNIIFVLFYIVIGFLIFLLPAVLLYIQYWRTNRNEEYYIKRDCIIYRKDGVETIYTLDELDKVEFYLTPGYFEKSGVNPFPIDTFYYAKLHLKNGKYLILTNLLAPRLEAEFQYMFDLKKERVRKRYCWVSKKQ